MAKKTLRSCPLAKATEHVTCWSRLTVVPSLSSLLLRTLSVTAGIGACSLISPVCKICRHTQTHDDVVEQ